MLRNRLNIFSTTLISFISLCGLKAQPVFTSANCFSIGDSTGMGSGASIVLISQEIAQTGNNYTWDYSSYNTGGPIYSWTSPIHSYVFQAGSDAPQLQFQNFPIHEDPGNTGLAYNRGFKYSNDADTLYLCAQGEQGSTVNIYNPPLPYLSFPLNFQQVGYADITNYFSTIPVSTTHREWSYDGFGKIILPYGVIDSVYRIHTVQRDSNFSFQTVVTLNEIIWFKKSTGIPVLRFTENSGSGFTAFYTSDISQTTGIENSSKSMFRLYPNPSNGLLSIECSNIYTNQTLQLKIDNCLGQEIFSTTLIEKLALIDLRTKCSEGLYFIRISDENGVVIETQKILME
jgi:hypothetical protein